MKRIAVVDNEKLKDMQLKEHIKNLCPINRSGTECITIGEDGSLNIDENSCIGCGICVKAAPDAIKIVNLPEQLNKDPLFRYGENKFSLYNIPIPIFGKIVGIIGRNGIGKSTAINILAGHLKPNLGKPNYNATNKEIIDYFKGTEGQAYFERLFNNQIKVAYKPQQIEYIAKQFDGTVIDLLKKADQVGRYEEISEKLDLKNILNNDVKKLSGGELQKLAIAATVLKDANVFIFDEPTSYLDIKQRLKITKFIRDMINDDIAVLLVEHDLIILDYLTDIIHITYGKENVYGVVSQPKSAKNGINVYISGYLREENVRFRDKKIQFNKRPPFIEKKSEMLNGWEGIKKKLGNFTLEADKGDINKGDVIGIIGENGIGKTTFVKMLANEIKPDSGKILTDLKVSYKPQQIESNDKLVAEVLQKAMQKYKTLLVAPFNFETIMYNKLSKLSGGQLQMVSVISTLAEDADLYLLDEPSAYLDIEQRLLLSKVIRDFAEQTGKTIIIVDHDLLFLDYISDKITIFDGQPGVRGSVHGPFKLEDGMNQFLKDIGITFRRDEETNRPRANKENSQMDKKQKLENKYYY